MNYLIYAGRKLVALLVGEHAYVNDDTRFTVGQTERGISGLTGLLTEDRAEKSLFCGKVGLSLGSNLTYKDIPCVYLGTLLYNAVCVEVAECILADVLDLTGDLLGAELGISCFVCT